MLGNLLIFAGPNVMNEYARLLHLLPILPLIEVYLLLAAVVHAIAAFHFTKTKWRAVLQRPAARGRLFWTSIFIVLFIVVHVRQFRFGSMEKWYNSAGSVG